MAIWYSKPASFNKELIWSATTTGDMFYEIWCREDDGKERSVMGSSIPPSALTKNETSQDRFYSGIYTATGHQGDPVTIPWTVTQKARYGNEYRILEGDQTNVEIPATATTWSFRWTIQKLNTSTQQYEFDHYEYYTSDPFSQNKGLGRIARSGFFNYMGMSRFWTGWQLGSGIKITFILNKAGTTETTSNYFAQGDIPIAPVVDGYRLTSTSPAFTPVQEEKTYTCYYERVSNSAQSTTVINPITLPYNNYNNVNSYVVKCNDNTIYVGRLYWTKDNDIKLSLNDLANQNIHFNYNIFDTISGNKITNYNIPKIDTYVNDNIVNSTSYYVDYRGANSSDGDFARTDFISDTIEPWQYITFSWLNIYPNADTIYINSTAYSINPYSQETIKYKVNGDSAVRVYNKTLTVDGCSKNKYVLYWQSKKGGFNWISVNGKAVEKESYTKSQYTSGNIELTKNTNWSDINYQTDVKKQFTFNIGHLDDRQSKLFAEIYGSPCIYVHCKDGNIYAVNCTDKNIDIKTRNNQGKKTYFYTINLTQSITTNIVR